MKSLTSGILFFSLGLSTVAYAGSSKLDLNSISTFPESTGFVLSDSLSIVKLERELSQIVPIKKDALKAKFKKEIVGFELTELEVFEDAETGTYCTANYKNGEKSIYLMITDGAGVGSFMLKETLLGYLEMKKYEEAGDLTNIKPYKGWMVYFDSSMYKSDGMTSIQYLEANRYSIVASGNQIAIADLKNFLDNLNLN